MENKEKNPMARFDYQSEEVKQAQLEILNWAMKLCSTGSTLGMVRVILYNKYVEISGEGEKA